MRSGNDNSRSCRSDNLWVGGMSQDSERRRTQDIEGDDDTKADYVGFDEIEDYYWEDGQDGGDNDCKNTDSGTNTRFREEI